VQAKVSSDFFASTVTGADRLPLRWGLSKESIVCSSESDLIVACLSGGYEFHCCQLWAAAIMQMYG